MSEQTTSSAGTATAAPGGRAAGRKYAGLTRNQWIGVAVVFAAAIGYILYRRSQAGAAAGTAAAGTTGSECTDASGNSVPCDQADLSGELSALQTELETLMASQGAGGGSGGGGIVTPVDTGTGPAGTPAPATSSSTPTTSTGATTTAAAAKTAGAVTGLKPSAVTKTSFKASWTAASNAAGGYQYTVRDLASHTQVKQGITKATSVTVSGLKPGTDYNFGIQALPGGAGANMHVRTT